MMADATIAGGAMAVLADATLKATVVLAVAGLWTLLDRSASAAVRHLVWAVGLASAVMLLVVVPFAPAWRVALPLPERPTFSLAGGASADEVAAIVYAAVADEAVTWSPDVAVGALPPVGSAVEAELPEMLWTPASQERIAGDDFAATFMADGVGVANVLLVVWLAGILALAAPRIRARLGLLAVQREGRPVRSLRVRGEARSVIAEMGVRRDVRLIESPAGSMPMTWGILLPVVLMPEDASTWTTTRLRAVLRHELAHVARLDALVFAIAELACVLHWFNPFVWFAAKRLREESEHACDDRVLADGEEPADYAAELVELARSLRPARAAALAGMAMARGRSLRGRLVAVLDDRRDRRGVSAADVARAVSLAMLAILPLACLAPAGAVPEPAAVEPPVAGDPRAADEAVIVYEAVTPPAADAPRVRRPQRPRPAPAGVPDVAEPPVPAQAPRGGVRGVPPAAVAVPSADVPRVRRSTDEPHRPPVLRAEPLPDAAPPVPRQRPSAPAPAARGTPEPERYQQGRRPDPDLTGRVLRQAALSISSDRELADLLELAVAGGGVSDRATRAAFLEAARTIESDRDQARALEAYLSTGPDEEGLILLLDVTAGISSDREAAALLEKVARTSTAPAVRDAIVRALDSVGSDRERQRVLDAIRRASVRR